jgi:hypothetical protein
MEDADAWSAEGGLWRRLTSGAVLAGGCKNCCSDRTEREPGDVACGPAEGALATGG